jgi:hypothetical protein
MLTLAAPLTISSMAYGKTFVFQDDVGNFEVGGLGYKADAEAAFNRVVAKNQANYAQCLINPSSFGIGPNGDLARNCGFIRTSFENPGQRDSEGRFYSVAAQYEANEFERFYEAEYRAAILGFRIGGWETEGLRVNSRFWEDTTHSGLHEVGGPNDNPHESSRTIVFDEPMDLISIDLSVSLHDYFDPVKDLYFLGVGRLDQTGFQIGFDAPFSGTFEFGPEFSAVTSLSLSFNRRAYSDLNDGTSGGLLYNNLVATVARTNISPVPLPAPILMLLAGLVGIGAVSKRAKR